MVTCDSCDEEIWHPNTFDRQRTIVISKNYRIVAGREAVSLSLSLYIYIYIYILLQGEIGMEGPNSLLAMCASAENQIPRPYLVLRKSPLKKKNHHVVNFQTTEDKLVAMWSSKDEHAQGVVFARWKTKNIIWGYERNPNSKTMRPRERRE